MELGVLEAFFEDAERLIERHAGREQMRELFREEILVRRPERLHRFRRGGRRGLPAGLARRLAGARGRGCRDGFDLDRSAALLLDLENRRRPVVASQNPVDELAFGISGDVAELGHRVVGTLWGQKRRQASRLALFGFLNAGTVQFRRRRLRRPMTPRAAMPRVLGSGTAVWLERPALAGFTADGPGLKVSPFVVKKPKG